MPDMSVHVIADLHGAAEALRKAVPDDATLLLLGDLLNVIDYIEMSGILVDVFGDEAVRQVNEMRLKGDLEEARRLMRERSLGREDEIRAEFGRLGYQQYESIFAALTSPTYLILGNVDVPKMAAGFVQAHPAVIDADASVFEIEGERFGFVGGALPTPLHVAGEITEEEMFGKISVLGSVDVLCSHIPPAVPDLCFDTLAGRMEKGSRDLLTYIQDVQPRIHYFGHVHQPLVSSMSIGRTRCVNVGYFRATKRAYPHQGPPA
jgi:Icc-related predicted phosphoesterase